MKPIKLLNEIIATAIEILEILDTIDIDEKKYSYLIDKYFESLKKFFDSTPNPYGKDFGVYRSIVEVLINKISEKVSSRFGNGSCVEKFEFFSK